MTQKTGYSLHSDREFGSLTVKMESELAAEEERIGECNMRRMTKMAVAMIVLAFAMRKVRSRGDVDTIRL